MNNNNNQQLLYPSLANYCAALEQEFDLITTERKEQLLLLRDYLASTFEQKQTAQVIVICTHNSRRSHLGQLWLAIGADYYQLPELLTFSGGTEATAFNIRAVKAFQRIGLEISWSDSNTENPVYQVEWSDSRAAYLAFSKKYDAAPNPIKNFAAIMVCTQADEGCPLVSGCNFRLSLPYEDPKAFDDTNLEELKYDERCRQIGREMLFVLKNIQL